MCKLGVYIDFDNIWASILDLTPTLKRRNEKNHEIITDVKNNFVKTINKIIEKLENDKIKYIKAFSDFDKLPLSKEIKIIDILHSTGIQTYIPYVRNNKDMSDRALIISAIKDIAIEQRDVDKIILITGDIDYLPLFEFLSNNTDIDFEILSFKNRLNDGYKDVFYIKNKISLIDKILNIDSQEVEENKKFNIFREFISEKNLDTSRLDYKKTAQNISNYYYCKIEERKIKKYAEKLQNELKKQKGDNNAN